MTPVSKPRTPPPPQEKFLNGGFVLRPGQRYFNRPGKEGRLRAAYFGRQIPTWSTEPFVLKRILLAAARRTCSVVLSEMCLSASAPEDVPATYFVGVRVSELRKSVSRLVGGAPNGIAGVPVRKSSPCIRFLFLQLRTSDALLECASWPCPKRLMPVSKKRTTASPRKEILNGGPYTESVEIPWTVPRARSPIQADRYRP